MVYGQGDKFRNHSPSTPTLMIIMFKFKTKSMMNNWQVELLDQGSQDQY